MGGSLREAARAGKLRLDYIEAKCEEPGIKHKSIWPELPHGLLGPCDGLARETGLLATKQGTKVDARYGAVGEFLAQSVHVQLCASVAGLDSHTPPASAPSVEGMR